MLPCPRPNALPDFRLCDVVNTGKTQGMDGSLAGFVEVSRAMARAST